MFAQIAKFFDTFYLSKMFFEKDSIQRYLRAIICWQRESFRWFVNRFVKDILLSRPWNSCPKIKDIRFTVPALKLIQNLSNKKQRTKVTSSYSEWLENIFRVQLGLVLRPLIFKYFLQIYFSFSMVLKL